METAHVTLLVIQAIILVAFLVTLVCSIPSMRIFNEKTATKWMAILATALALVSIPRLIVAIQLGKSNWTYWAVVPIWVLAAIFDWISYRTEK